MSNWLRLLPKELFFQLNGFILYGQGKGSNWKPWNRYHLEEDTREVLELVFSFSSPRKHMHRGHRVILSIGQELVHRSVHIPAIPDVENYVALFCLPIINSQSSSNKRHACKRPHIYYYVPGELRSRMDDVD